MTVAEQTRSVPAASASAAAALGASSRWVAVCRLSDLEVERGRAALIGDTQLALFLLADGSVRAVSNFDPYGKANVLSRGIVGTKSLGNNAPSSGNNEMSESGSTASREDVPTIASPLHKQAWDLRTGMVVETQGKDARDIPVWPVAVQGDEVLVRFP
ncbi:nitrite reductase (NAD(P)H) small subunit [Microbacterium stercoris]|uniref:Nitrite reductase (NAD(P)H) small subunit n=1 Tax=Microbacterium stercoris TaxID=2820289 RepID=A0A939QNN1_9MICO|nr:nitrite reductase (NAD(P)H) small subunit [Microbacterium stercoris]MBO3663985.1 nitrite reductase (NAD(P)H) small subunit [Microbacterium stercoris]